MTVAELTAPVLKMDRELRIAYGPVLVPGEPDHDGDVVTKEKVQQVAYNFMEEYGNIDLQHSLKNVGKVIESWLTPMEMTFKTRSGEEVTVPEGTWMMGVKVTDDEAWKAVKSGCLTGFSIMGIRAPVFKSAQQSFFTDPMGAAQKFQASVKRTTLSDLGPDWVCNAVSLVDEPCVPKAKFIAIKSKGGSGDTGTGQGFFAKLKSAFAGGAGGDPPVQKSDPKGGVEVDAEKLTTVIKQAVSEGISEGLKELAVVQKNDGDVNRDTGAQDPKQDDQEPQAASQPDGSGDSGAQKSQDQNDQKSAQKGAQEPSGGGEETVVLKKADYDRLMSIADNFESLAQKSARAGTFFGSRALVGQDGDGASTKGKTFEDTRDAFGRKRKPEKQ